MTPSDNVETDPVRSRLMSRIRQAGTQPELVVRAALRCIGIGYRLNTRDLPGSPDVANKGRRWAIFVHGCYWHHHTNCARATVPKRNREFWLGKFATNRRRDARAIRELRAEGFRVIIVWECQTRRPVELVQRLKRRLA